MKQWELARMAKIVQTSYPEIFDAAVKMATPSMVDTSLIPMFYEFYKDTYPVPQPYITQADKDENHLYRLRFVAAILDLYCPEALYSCCIVTGKVCTILSDLFGYNHRQSMTPFVSQVKTYIKNPFFRDAVKKLGMEFVILQSKGKNI